MRALYEIDEDILSCVDTETGEVIDTNKLKALEMERDAKIEQVILWRKDLLAEAEAVKAEADKLNKRAKMLNVKADQLKGYTKYVLQGEKFKTPRCSVSYRTTKSIVIDDVTKIPKNFYKMPTEDWISKSDIKEVIESGVEVEGAHQEESQSIIIK